MVPRDDEMNLALKQYQMNVDGWEVKDLAVDLHQWAERMVIEFKLNCRIPALMLDQLPRSEGGHFRYGRNGFGLLNELAINLRYFSPSNYWNMLATLLHELLHAEQAQAGHTCKGNYHNNAFRERAKFLGLIVDRSGHTCVAPLPSRFLDILTKYGVEIPKLTAPEPVITREAGCSKLKLWTCSCKPEPVRVRVAISDFQAKCLKCNQLFVKKE